jgi:hypothetical protein
MMSSASSTAASTCCLLQPGRARHLARNLAGVHCLERPGRHLAHGQLEALTASTCLAAAPARAKLLDEEQFHSAHGAAWLRRLAAGGPAASAAGAAAARALLPGLLQWFGPESTRANALNRAGIVGALPGDLRDRLLRRVAPWLADMVAPQQLEAINVAFEDFDEATRRPRGTTPDAATITRIRGDKNRAFLMD